MSRVQALLEEGVRWISIVGDPGSGKSHHLRLLAHRWSRDEGDVLALSGAELASVEDLIEAVAVASGAWIAPLVTVEEASALLVSGLASGPPTLLLIDDIDGAAVEPLRAITAWCESVKTLRVVTTSSPSTPLRARAEDARTVELSPLEVAEARELLEARIQALSAVDEARGRRPASLEPGLVRRLGGRPRTLMLAAADPRGAYHRLTSTTRRDRADVDAGLAHHTLVRASVAALDPKAIEVLGLVSAWVRPWTDDVVSEALGGELDGSPRARAPLAAVLAGLARRGLLDGPLAGKGTYAPVSRAIVEALGETESGSASLLSGRRAHLHAHRRVADDLRWGGDRARLRARSVLAELRAALSRLAEPHGPLAARLLLAYMPLVRRHRLPEPVMASIDRTLAGEGLDPVLRADLRALRMRALSSGGRNDLAEADADAIDLATTSPHARFWGRYVRARAMGQRGRSAEALTLCERAHAEAEGAGLRNLMSMASTLASSFVAHAGDARRQRAFVLRALAELDATDDPSAAEGPVLILAHAHANALELVELRALLATWRPTLERPGAMGQHDFVYEAATLEAWVTAALEGWQSARDRLRDALAVEPWVRPQRRGAARLLDAIARLAQGDPHEARAILPGAAASLRESHSFALEPVALGVLGVAHAACADERGARDAFDDARRSAADHVIDAAQTTLRALEAAATLMTAAARATDDEQRSSSALDAAATAIAADLGPSRTSFLEHAVVLRLLRETTERFTHTRKPLPSMRPPSGRRTLELHHRGAWFRIDDGARAALREGGPTARLLLALAARAQGPAPAPIDAAELVSLAWPGDVVAEDVALNRLRVAIRSLRERGLEGVIVTVGSAYCLTDTVDVRIYAGA